MHNKDFPSWESQLFAKGNSHYLAVNSKRPVFLEAWASIYSPISDCTYDFIFKVSTDKHFILENRIQVIILYRVKKLNI